MNSTEFIEKCQENNYGTAIYIVDEEGNEYTVEGIGTTMFGQFHLCVEIKNQGKPPKPIPPDYPLGLPEWIISGETGKCWYLLSDYKFLFYGDDDGNRLYQVNYFNNIDIAVESMKNVLKFNGYV